MLTLLAALSAPALAADALAADVSDACSDGDLNCESVVVTASRTDAGQKASDATAPVIVVSREQIEASGATTVDEALRGIPGVQITRSHGGAGLSLQGLDADQTLVLIDGRPIAGRVAGTVDLARIAVADIERIEIMPGPASALYGSEALGGVIQIVTRHRGGALALDAAVRTGTRQWGQVSGGVSGGSGALRGGVSAHSSVQDGWDADPSDVATTGDAARLLGWRAWSSADVGSSVTVDVNGDYEQRDTSGVQANGAGAVFDARSLQETADAAVGVRILTGAASLVRARVAGTVWRQQYLEDQRDSDVQDRYEQTFDRRAYGNLAWQWVPLRHVVAAGVDGSVEGLESARLDGGVASRGRVALYAQDDWTVSEGATRVSVSPGARLDWDTQFGLHGTPHLAVRVDPIPRLALRLSGGAGYRAPEFKELYLAFNHASYGYELNGNPELRPETSLGGTLDARWGVAVPVELRAQGWWNEVYDLIDPQLMSEGTSSAPAAYTYANVGRAVSRGGSAGVAWVRQGPLAASLDYTFTDARNRSDAVPLDGKAPHALAARVQVRPTPALQLAGTLDWSSPRPFTLDDTTTYAPATTWVDTQIAWTVHPGVVVEGGVHNLLGAQDDTYMVLAPRTFYVGVRAAGSPFSPPENP